MNIPLFEKDEKTPGVFFYLATATLALNLITGIKLLAFAAVVFITLMLTTYYWKIEKIPNKEIINNKNTIINTTETVSWHQQE